jgi:acetylglutamate/LysW-gamma-L-alpha-aminoadipate kinase
MLVVKVGGGEGIDYDAICADLASQENFILVHGGSSKLNEVSTLLGHPPKFVTSISGHESRFTDRDTLEMFNMVYAGYMNKMLVEKLQTLGINAIGLTGLDGRLAEGRQKKALKIVENGVKKVLRGDHSGTIQNINSELLHLLLDQGYVPILTPPAISEESVAINVDGDRFAGQIAIAMKAKTLLLLSNVPGLLKSIDDESSLIESISYEEIDLFLNDIAKGRMKKKLLGAKEALDGGVSEVVIGDARAEAPIKFALSGKGTKFSK